VFIVGLVIGIAGHLARDLTESHAGVPLLWPWSYTSYRASHTAYLIVMGVLAWLACVRAIVERRGPAREHRPPLIARQPDPAAE
jgi:membrane-bound metal-dependent hydrolase YbcI (DUF457 family)